MIAGAELLLRNAMLSGVQGSAIQGVGIGLAEHSYTKDEILAAATQWLRGEPELFALFERYLRASKSVKRHYILEPTQLLSLGGQQERARLYLEHGKELAKAAICSALAQSNLSGRDLSHLIITSCTMPLIPSLDTYLIQELDFPLTITRIPIYQHGCAGGISGLSLAASLAGAGKPVLLVSVEICSLVFHKGDISPSGLVGAALFSDGAASVVVSPDTAGLTVIDAQSTLIRGTTHLMGYDIFDDGPYLRLDKELPEHVARETPALVRAFLQKHSLQPEDIGAWLIHPGGTKILDALQRLFSLRHEQMHWAYDVLSNYGNMSSASALFVLAEFFQSPRYRLGDYVLMLGIGPGITVEMILFRV